MPARVDASGIRTYAEFEAHFDALVDRIAGSLTDEHIWVDPDGRGSSNGLALVNGTRVIANTDRPNHRSLCVVLEQDGTALVSGPERGKAGAWRTRHTIHDALGLAVLSALHGPATQYANKQTTGDPEAVRVIRNAELLRLLRMLDDRWADRIEEHGYFASR